MSIVKILRSATAGHVPAVAVAATGSITFTTQPLANTSITLGGTSVSFVAADPTGNEVLIQDNLPDTLTALLAFLQASDDANLVKATYAFNDYVLEVTYYTQASAGNSFTLATTVGGSTVSGATLDGGVDGIQSGRIAINEADGILFWLDADGETVESFNFTNPTVPTPGIGDNSEKAANTEWVNENLDAIVGSPPQGLSTLADIAAAINDDPNYWQTINGQIITRLRFDQAQTLSPAQLAQGQSNLGLQALLSDSALRFDEVQALTTGELTQVQANLGLPAALTAAFNAWLVPTCGQFNWINSAQVIFAPKNGNLVKIAGVLYTIPSGGVVAGYQNIYVNGQPGQSLAAYTSYYVYLFVNDGVLTIDFSTTGHATDTTSGNAGVEIKSGDNSRTLIGRVYTSPNANFQDASNWLGILSWFNRRAKTAVASIGNITTGAYDIWTALSNNYITMMNWADEAVEVWYECQAQVNEGQASVAVGMDGTQNTFDVPQYILAGVSTAEFEYGNVPTATGGMNTPAEGAHDYFAYGQVETSGATLSTINGYVVGQTFG